MKKTGYMVGPNHRMGTAMMMDKGGDMGKMQKGGMMEGATGEAPEAQNAEGPPNLHDSAGLDNCGECQHYQANECAAHGGHRVTPNQVCDDFASGENAQEGRGEPEQPQPEAA